MYCQNEKNNIRESIDYFRFGLWCLLPLSTIFHNKIYRGSQYKLFQGYTNFVDFASNFHDCHVYCGVYMTLTTSSWSIDFGQFLSHCC